MADDKKKDKKKDLTGIFDLPQADPLPESESDPFAVNELAPVEQIGEFDSIESLGMMDHPVVPEETAAPAEEPQTASGDDLAFPTESSDFASTPEITPTSEYPPFESAPPPLPEPEVTVPLMEASPPMDFMDDLKDYSERGKNQAFDPGTRYPFHLYITGDIDEYTRDRLLRFIDENPIGTNSEDLDLQINSGRVLFPRISEFSGIKLIQDLRDRGLSFRLNPSPEDEGERHAEQVTTPVSFSAGDHTFLTKNIDIPVLPHFKSDEFEVIDSIQMIQYLKSEILEVEKSELFQELLDRMLASMKRKAKIKGASALASLEHKITPLRLPSQYQVEMKASLVKKIEA